MKLTLCVVSAALLWATSALAQAPAPGKVTLAAGIRTAYDNIKRNLREGADKMQEADYGFKPTPEIRTFGQLFGHVANSQFNTCAAAKGEPNPNQGNDNEKKTTKAEFIKALEDSFAYCDAAYASLTDETAVEFIKLGPNEVMRAVALANNVSHNNEMYGTAAVYMRLKGLVPPSTERRMQMQRPR